MKRFVVYTVLTGGYDIIQQPTVVDDKFDYILFTDDKHSEEVGVWQVRSFEYKNSDKTKESRYPKMHPEKLLADYEAWLYIDANVQITGQEIYNKCLDLYSRGIDWGAYKMFNRDCIYEESLVVLINQFERIKNVFVWCNILRQERYPRYNGLYINNVIFRIHNERVRCVDELWWDLYNKYSRRDQLFLPYVFWKIADIKFDWLLPPGENAWATSSLKVSTHTNINHGRIIKNRKFFSFIQRCMTKINYKRYFNVFYRLCGLRPNLATALFVMFEISFLIVYSPIALLKRCKSLP